MIVAQLQFSVFFLYFIYISANIGFPWNKYVSIASSVVSTVS